jgi:hypothetical protein
MTWDQFAAVLLGLAATALVRLLDRWLPPTRDDDVAPAVVHRQPPPPPMSGDLDIVDDEG